MRLGMRLEMRKRRDGFGPMFLPVIIDPFSPVGEYLYTRPWAQFKG